LQMNVAEIPAKGIVMQNKASDLPASLLRSWERAVEVPAKAAEILTKTDGAPARGGRHAGKGC
jgi:hypothetical protein